MNMFEQASRQGFRFPSVRGLITTEQLWTLPLTSTQGFDLDTIAQAVNKEIKASLGESFVNRTKDPAQEELGVHLEILKHIIAVKLEEAQTARDKMKLKAELEKYVGVLADKQDAALKDLPLEEVEKRVTELRNKLGT
jgi:hypothetical protein